MTNSKHTSHAISVIMPVFNGERYVYEAVRSILSQEFTDFEFVIIDDGSVDRTSEILKQFKDDRILYFKNPSNEGNYPCRNKGLDVSSGKYICVMDADDISEPERFRIQFQFMENNPDVGICGTFIRNLPSNIVPRFITDCNILRVAFLSNNYCSHPSLMMRNEFLIKHNLRYNEEYYYSADFDLCARGLRHFKVCNIPEILIKYRRHPGQISFDKAREQENYADMIRVNQLKDFLGFNPEEIPVLLHLKLMKKYPLSFWYKDKAEQWIQEILCRNKVIGYYKQDILKHFLYNALKSCMYYETIGTEISTRIQ